jgi:hypothetical protein
MLTATQLAALKSELLTDPRGYGYAGKQDTDIETALNTVRDGTAGTVPANPTGGSPAGLASGVITVNKGSISTQDLVECVVQSEMPTNAASRDWLLMVCAGERVRVDAGSTTRTGLLALFAQNSTTRTALTAIATKPGSRAEELLGVGVTPTYLDVAAARNA